jgi:glutathione S-transferase
VELLLSLLGIKANIIEVDLKSGEQKQPDFLAKNIFGQVPLLEDGDNVIADSNAILIYLATKYDPERQWLPTDATQAAQVQRFLSVAAGLIANGPALARIVNLFGTNTDPQPAIETAHKVLTVLEKHLDNRLWLATNHATIADIANYAYIAHAPEGNVALNDYPNVRAWLQRIENLDGFVPMPSSKIGLAA